MSLRIGLGLGMMPTSARTPSTTPPVNVVAPSITGILTQGRTLTANPGSWAGFPSGGYAYQWQRSGSNISGATSSTYVPQAADVSAGASALTVEVTATNDNGSSMAESAGVTIAAPLTISGTPGGATVGSPYTFTPSSSGGHTPKSYALTGTLPSGLSFNTSTGAITGTPVSSGTASGLNITVTDADGLTAALGTFSLVVDSGDFAPIAGLKYWTKAAMPNLIAAKAAMLAGTSDLIVVVGGPGDSTSVSYKSAGNNYQNCHRDGAPAAKMVAGLVAAGMPALYDNLFGDTGNLGGTGFQASDWDTLVYENPNLSRSGTGFTLGSITTMGGGIIWNITDADATSTVSWTVSAESDTFEFTYLRHSSASSYQVSIDGGAYSSAVSMNGADAVLKATISLGATTGSPRTVTLRKTSGGRMYIFGRWGRHSTNKKTLLWNWGKSSAQMTNAFGDTSQSYSVGNQFYKYGAHVAFINCLINDQASAGDPTASIAAFSAIVTLYRANNCDVVAVMPQAFSDNLTVRNTYLAALDAACAGFTPKVPLLDLASTYTNLTAWQGAGFGTNDSQHLSAAGTAYVGDRYNALLIAA